MSSNPTVTLTQQNGYQFLIDFGVHTPDLLVARASTARWGYGSDTQPFAIGRCCQLPVVQFSICTYQIQTGSWWTCGDGDSACGAK